MSHATRGTFIAPESLNPPILPAPDAILSSSPSMVMFDQIAYIGDNSRKNRTFARAITRTGAAIGVSLWLTDPPAISHLCIHCSSGPGGGLKVTDIMDEPTVICSGKDVAIICVVCNPGVRPIEFIHEMGMADCDYLAYRAHADSPSLDMLASPKPKVFHREIGFSPCGGGDGDGREFLLAMLRPRLVHLQYDLHVFSSKTNTWTTSLAMLQPPWPGYRDDYLVHQSDVVIMLRGGLLSWVDLWRGILLFSVLDTDPIVRYIEFPKPMHGNMWQYHLKNPARAVRDVTFADGVIKLVEIQKSMGPGNTEPYAPDGWTTVTWCRELFSDSWRQDCKAYVSTSSILTQLRDNQSVCSPQKTLQMAGPLWSMDSGDVVYLMAKVEFHDKLGWTIAFNTRNSTLDGVTSFPAES